MWLTVYVMWFNHTIVTSNQWLQRKEGRKEGNVLFNDAFSTFYLWLYGVRHMVKDHTKTKEETCICHMGYSFRLTARVLLYAPSHTQDNTYQGLCYTSCGALAGTRNSSLGPSHEGSIRRPIAPWANALTTELHLAPGCKGGFERRWNRDTATLTLFPPDLALCDVPLVSNLKGHVSGKHLKGLQWTQDSDRWLVIRARQNTIRMARSEM